MVKAFGSFVSVLGDLKSLGCAPRGIRLLVGLGFGRVAGLQPGREHHLYEYS